jgi:hypothetical protein
LSRETVCPKCGNHGEHADLGYIEGRHIFRCKTKGCLWEEKIVRKAVGKDDPIKEKLV